MYIYIFFLFVCIFPLPYHQQNYLFPYLFRNPVLSRKRFCVCLVTVLHGRSSSWLCWKFFTRYYIVWQVQYTEMSAIFSFADVSTVSMTKLNNSFFYFLLCLFPPKAAFSLSLSLPPAAPHLTSPHLTSPHLTRSIRTQKRKGKNANTSASHYPCEGDATCSRTHGEAKQLHEASLLFVHLHPSIKQVFQHDLSPQKQHMLPHSFAHRWKWEDHGNDNWASLIAANFFFLPLLSLSLSAGLCSSSRQAKVWSPTPPHPPPRAKGKQAERQMANPGRREMG